MASANLEDDSQSSLTSIERGLLMLKTHLEAFRRRCTEFRVTLTLSYIHVSEACAACALTIRFAYHLRQWQIEGTGISSHLKALSDKQSLPLRIVCQPAGLPDKVTAGGICPNTHSTTTITQLSHTMYGSQCPKREKMIMCLDDTLKLVL